MSKDLNVFLNEQQKLAFKAVLDNFVGGLLHKHSGTLNEFLEHDAMKQPDSQEASDANVLKDLKNDPKCDLNEYVFEIMKEQEILKRKARRILKVVEKCGPSKALTMLQGLMSFYNGNTKIFNSIMGSILNVNVIDSDDKEVLSLYKGKTKQFRGETSSILDVIVVDEKDKIEKKNFGKTNLVFLDSLIDEEELEESKLMKLDFEEDKEHDVQEDADAGADADEKMKIIEMKKVEGQ